MSFPASEPSPVDLTGTWRLELPRSGGVVVRSYLKLSQEGSRLHGTIVINEAANLPLLRARLEDDVGFFGIAWNADYRVQREGAGLQVEITYHGKRIERAVAVRVPEHEAAPPAPGPLPARARLSGRGLALTPPMGWNSWNHFSDTVDDRIIRETADALVASGLAAAGYTYVNIDDGWSGGRDAAGTIVPNSKFPDMRALADYVHQRGLKIGLYTSPGPRTCGGYEGSHGHEERDARTFADWGIDYLKFDVCSALRIYGRDELPAVFQKMGQAIADCGRPMVYSINGAADGSWEWASEVGANLWRTTDDIQDNWRSVSAIGFGQRGLSRFARPGHWNDPDMLEVGNGGMSPTEYRTHFSLWCLLAAPLIAGNDLRAMSAETLEILSNTEAIAINQDPLGRAAEPILTREGWEIWQRPLNDGGQAIGIFNRDDVQRASRFAWEELGRDAVPSRVRDVWQHSDVPQDPAGFSVVVPAHGVVMLRLR